MAIKILLVEDDPDIAHLLSLRFKLLKFDIDVVVSGEKALERASNESYNLFVIDRMLPGISGTVVCRKLRSDVKNVQSPIIIVTALSRPDEVIEGLNAGADDYVTKPFDINVLIARVNSVLRRYQVMKDSSEQLNFGNIKINFSERKIWHGIEELILTKSEYKILALLFKNARKVLSREELVNHVQGEKIHVTERTIDTHVAAIRKKLKESSNIIETIRGVGYRINV